MIEKKNILSVGITNATKKEILEYIIKSLENFKKKYFVVTPNPEFLVLANKNSNFKNILNRADLASADGIGIIIASKILGRPLKTRFTGIDLVKSLCKEVAKKPITVGFLGGGANVAEKAAECLRKKYSGLKVNFAQKEWPNELIARQPRISGDVLLSARGPVSPSSRPTSSVTSTPVKQANSAFSLRSLRSLDGTPSSRATPRDNNLTMKQFNSETIDILFVAFGVPKQEIWISENLEKIPVKIAIGVGGALDYISGRIGRAPIWVQNIGLEWLYRLVRQPWRIKRQLSLLKFIWLVFKEKLNKN